MTLDSRLSDLQLAIMHALWRDGEATVAQVHASLRPDRGLAPTTIATVLSRLEKRGLIIHRAEGRQFIYRARVSEAQVRRSMVSDLTDLLFEGDPAQLVSHLLSGRDIAPADLARVKALIEAREQSGSGAAAPRTDAGGEDAAR